MPIAPGENVGPYRVIEQLGSGGMATVFKAYHPSLDRYVAIKVLHPAFKSNPQFFERFKREARIVANLEHPHIIPVYDFNEYKSEPYLVMRFVEGETLKPTLQGKPLPPDRILQLMRPTCDALAYAHRQGVLHRDIKPSNIMVAQNGHVFLSDFGLARMVQAGESTLSQDVLLGTPQYISPEQAQGFQTVDGRSDIYSLGVVLFEMLTGQVPFNADTPFATVHDHIYAPLPLPSRINPNIDPAVERLLLKALAKEPEQRFATATDLLAALEDTLAPQITIASPARPRVLNQPQPTVVKKPHPWWVPVGITALVVLVLGLMLIGVFWLRKRSMALQNQPANQMADIQATPVQTSSAPAEPEATLGVVDAVALTEQANRAMRQNQAAQATDLYEQAIAADPHYLPAYFGLSGALYQQDDVARAMAILQTAVANNPENGDAMLRLGEAQLFLANDPEAALASFEQAARLEPQAALPQAGRALALIALDRLDEAKVAIDAALSLDPARPEARMAQAVYLVKQGNRRAALLELQAVIRNSEASLLLKNRAEQFLEELRE